MDTNRERVIEYRNGVEVPPKANGGTLADQADKLTLPAGVWRGVFDDYRKAMKEATEAPDVFHFSTLLVRAGAALGRRVWFSYGMKLYPNFYVVNFGPTGDRKTTAQRYFDHLGSAPVKVIRGAGSGEALADEFQNLEGATPCVIALEEFAELARRGRWEGATVLQFLTTCFDCPPRYELKFRKKPVCIEEPTPNLVAGTTPDWFWQSARLADFQGGFGNRILFFTGTRKAAIPFPCEPDLTMIAMKVDALEKVANGPARPSADARGLWEAFYRAWESAQQKRDPMLRVAVERIPAYVIKVAMVYGAFEGSLPEITRDQLGASVLVGDYCTNCAEELLSLQNSGTNPTKELERRILAFVTQAPSRQTTKREIYKALWRHYSDASQFDRSFRALVNAGELHAEPGPRGTWLVSIP